MFANHKLAFAAAEMEVHEAKGRLAAQNQLAAAEAQVSQRHFQLTPLGMAVRYPSERAAACMRWHECRARSARILLLALVTADTGRGQATAGALHAAYTWPLTALPAAALPPR